MLRYIGKRILIAIPTFLGITVLVYVLSSMAPGTPLEMIFNDPNATAGSDESKAGTGPAGHDTVF